MEGFIRSPGASCFAEAAFRFPCQLTDRVPPGLRVRRRPALPALPPRRLPQALERKAYERASYASLKGISTAASCRYIMRNWKAVLKNMMDDLLKVTVIKFIIAVDKKSSTHHTKLALVSRRTCGRAHRTFMWDSPNHETTGPATRERRYTLWTRALSVQGSRISRISR